MQRDRILFDKIKNEFQKPILRFYQWERPALSYGRTQGLDAATRTLYQNKKWDVVQRPTGGGIVLHKNDLCFSILWRKGCNVLPWKITDSYRMIHEWMQSSLSMLGISSSPATHSNVLPGGWCFENPICYDLLAEGKKIVGGAQWRDGNTALHQGSIQLNLPERSIFIFKKCFEDFFHVKFQ